MTATAFVWTLLSPFAYRLLVQERGWSGHRRRQPPGVNKLATAEWNVATDIDWSIDVHPWKIARDPDNLLSPARRSPDVRGRGRATPAIPRSRRPRG